MTEKKVYIGFVLWTIFLIAFCSVLTIVAGTTHDAVKTILILLALVWIISVTMLPEFIESAINAEYRRSVEKHHKEFDERILKNIRAK